MCGLIFFFTFENRRRKHYAVLCPLMFFEAAIVTVGVGVSALTVWFLKEAVVMLIA